MRWLRAVIAAPLSTDASIVEWVKEKFFEKPRCMVVKVAVADATAAEEEEEEDEEEEEEEEEGAAGNEHAEL